MFVCDDCRAVAPTYVLLSPHERQSAWLLELEGASRHFGGVAHEVLIDNAEALFDLRIRHRSMRPMGRSRCGRQKASGRHGGRGSTRNEHLIDQRSQPLVGLFLVRHPCHASGLRAQAQVFGKVARRHDDG